MGSFKVTPDANTRRFAGGTGSPRLRGPVGDVLDFCDDCAWLQRNALKVVPAGVKSDLRQAKRLKTALHDFSFVFAGGECFETVVAVAFRGAHSYAINFVARVI